MQRYGNIPNKTNFLLIFVRTICDTAACLRQTAEIAPKLSHSYGYTGLPYICSQSVRHSVILSFTFFHKTNSYNGLIFFIPPNIALIGLSTLYMFPHPVTRNADCPCSLRNRRVCCYFYAIKNLANFTVTEILPSIKFI